MAQAVTHILVPLFLIALYRDFFVSKNKKKIFPLHYVLIAGIGGVLPDIDFILTWISGLLGYSTEGIHRTFTHTIFVPLIFLLLYFVLWHDKIPALGKHKLKINVICLMLSFGTLIHLILDALVSGSIMPFYPFSSLTVGLNLVNLLPTPLNSLALPTLDGTLLILYLIYLEVKHKISDFI